MSKLLLKGGLNRCSSSSRRSDDQSYVNDLFQKLPDDLIVFLLTKLSSRTSSDNNVKDDSLGDLKALGRCLSVSKRFNSLVSLVPSLYTKRDVNHENPNELNYIWPKILKMCLSPVQ